MAIRSSCAKPNLSSFRGAPLGAGPESILPIVVMDSGLALRAPRNDGLISIRGTNEICSRRCGVICPSGVLSTGVSTPFCKNISLHPSGIISTNSRHPPHKRGVGHRHERGVGCGGRGSVLRATGLQGGSKDL